MKGIKKLTMAIVMALLMTQGASVVSAATIAELQAQLAQLTSQLSGMQTQTVTYIFTRNLTVGSRGVDVQKLQQFLISAGYLKNASATTYFGVQTRAALAAWQKAKGISPAVGYFGPTTRARVNATTSTGTTPAASYAFTRNLTVGSTGADVQRLQEFLMRAGYLNIPSSTTYFGAQTKAALMAWQRANGMPTGTGGFEAVTRGKVNAAIAAVTPVTPITPSVSYISRPVAVVVGSSVAVKFTSTGARNANIYLCKTQIDCKTVIGVNVPVIVGENTFSWNVPADVTSGSYTIKIEDVANSNWVVYTDVPLTQPVVAPITATSTATTTPSIPPIPPTQPILVAISLQTPTSTKVGEVLSIKFTTRNAKNVSIAICANAASGIISTSTAVCNTTIASSIAVINGNHTYDWSIPLTTAESKYFIKMRDADSATSTDFTSDLFSITQLVPTITITTPGATTASSSLNINFTSKNVKNASIVLCRNATSGLISTSTAMCDMTVVLSIAVVDGSQTYNWFIPNTITVGQYFIKMKEDGINRAEFTSGAFTISGIAPIAPVIPAITITTPVSTVVGSSLSVQFNTKNITSISISFCQNATIGLITAANATCNEIESNMPVTDGNKAYSWIVLASTTPGQYFIKIKDMGSAIGIEKNSTSFSIIAIPAGPVPTISISQPAGTSIGKSLAFTASTTRLTGIDVYLCATKARCDLMIEHDFQVVDGGNTYAWMVPAAINPGSYYVKITAASSTTPYAITGTYVTIGGAPMQCHEESGYGDVFTTCNSGETAYMGQCAWGGLSPFFFAAYKDNVSRLLGKGIQCTIGATFEGLVKMQCCK